MFHKSIRYCVVTTFDIVLYSRLIQKIIINFAAGNFQIPSLGIYMHIYVCVCVCVCVRGEREWERIGSCHCED